VGEADIDEVAESVDEMAGERLLLLVEDGKADSVCEALEEKL
jgi:hypothetical protein